MNKKLVIRIVTDVLMTISLLLLMPYSLLSETAHEWIGMAMLILFIFHHVLNRRWIKSVAKGKYKPLRIIQTLLVGCDVTAYAWLNGKRNIAFNTHI